MSYCPNYFSIEDIVLQDVRVSCKFEVSVPKLGKHFTNFNNPQCFVFTYSLSMCVTGMLDQSADDQDLKQGSKVELPFWMVPTLHSKKVISLEIPRHYKVNYRQILQADSIVVDLHKWGPYFYDLGLHVANLDLKDSPDIKKSLVDTLLNRLRQIMDMSQHSTHHETVHLIANLDELERKLFAVGQLSFRSYKEWVRRESSKINTASLVASHRKRKFAEVTI
uniref:DNA replication complex GINS protein PSF3 n=1 Tax=Simocephalus serrulatus TaxID=117539 RepID=A0A4Y7NMU5_9CRUS|nr:EOG090X0G8U [Simocephalus serrulatus]